MVDQRNWIHVFGSFATTALFSAVAYGHYGSIIHRSTWDRQHIWLPILFILCPPVFLCQICMNAILVFQRWKAMRRLRVARYNEGFWFYVASILDLHTEDREFAQGRVVIAGAGGGHEQKTEGMWRLSTLNSSRLSCRHKYQADLDRGKHFGRVAITLVLLYQGASAVMTYVGRVRSIRGGMLSIDHLTGIYAIAGTVVELATLIILLQPYEWLDNNEYIEAERHAMPDVDTSNAWVYEGFLAATFHGLVWVALQSWVFFGTSTATTTNKHQTAQPKESVRFLNVFTGPGIAVLVLAGGLGLPLMIPTITEIIRRPSRGGTVWLAQRIGLTYYSGGVAARILLAAVSTVVACMIWMHAGAELNAVAHDRTHAWNAEWQTPNPTADTLYGAFLSLYS